MSDGELPTIVIKPRLRPVTSQLKDPFTLLIKHWALLLAAEGIAFFVSIAVVLFAVIFFMSSAFVQSLNGMKFSDAVSFLFAGYAWVGFVAVFVPCVLVWLWASGVMITALGSKENISLADDLKRGFRTILPLFMLALLVMFAYMGGSLLLFFPAVILALGLSLSWFMVVLEGMPVLKAIGTSWHITKGVKWSILGRLLLLLLIVWAIAIILALISLVPFIGLFSIPLQIALNLISTPYILAYFYCIYEDVRAVRREVYPMTGGITTLMIIYWLVAIAATGGAALVGIMAQK